MDRPSFSSNAPMSPRQPTSGSSQDDLEQKYKHLRQEHERLSENRMRRTIMLQQAKEEDERCRREAQAFGANTPQELEAILLERRKAATEQLDAFEKALALEASLQHQIEQDLAAAENR